jgi:hypothetical protein
MKQTAVEWFEDQVGHNSLMALKEFNEIFEKAKEMEREQIRDAHFTSTGCNSFDMPTDRINSAYKAAEQYYNETYKQL